MGRILTSEGDQLELGLGQSRVPWDGRSPRGLTKVAMGLTNVPIALVFNREVAGHEVFFRDTNQVDLWPSEPAFWEKEPPHLWGGSPSLLPLP